MKRARPTGALEDELAREAFAYACIYNLQREKFHVLDFMNSLAHYNRLLARVQGSRLRSSEQNCDVQSSRI